MEYTFGIAESRSFKDISHMSNSIKMESLIRNDGKRQANEVNPSMMEEQPIDAIYLQAHNNPSHIELPVGIHMSKPSDGYNILNVQTEVEMSIQEAYGYNQPITQVTSRSRLNQQSEPMP